METIVVTPSSPLWWAVGILFLLIVCILHADSHSRFSGRLRGAEIKLADEESSISSLKSRMNRLENEVSRLKGAELDPLKVPHKPSDLDIDLGLDNEPNYHRSSN